MKKSNSVSDHLKSFDYYPDLVLLFSFLISILNLNLVSFDHEISRDLIRAFEWLNLKPSSWLGPEISTSTSRLVGPFYYWLMGALWGVTRSIEGLLFAKILFSFVCFYVLIRELKKNFSASFSTLWSLIFLSAPLFLISMRQLENASWLSGFCCLIFFAVLKYRASNQSRWIWFSSVVSLLALQIHIAILIPYFAFLSSIVISFWRRQDAVIWFCGICFLLGLCTFPLFKEILYIAPVIAFLALFLYEKFLSPQPVLKFAFVSTTLLFVGINASITFKSYVEQSKLARTVQLIPNAEALDMTLKMKKFIYSLIPPEKTPAADPFSSLHGRAINRMRRDELNPDQTAFYFGLYQSLFDSPVVISPDIKDQTPDSAWLFQLRNPKEMALGPQAAFLLTEIKPQSLPQKVVIKYLNDRAQGIEKIHWTNSNLILPFAFLSYPEKTKVVRLEFTINSQTDKYLNLLLDNEQSYKLLQVKINSKVQSALEQYLGNSENQSQFTYKIPDKAESARVVIELKVLTDQIPNFSRLDVFTSGYILASEI